MRRLFLVMAISLFVSHSTPTRAGTAVTLCQRDEQILFHCSVQGGRKMVSLCGAPQLTATAGYLQYRFGSAQKVELEFPSQRAESQKQFLYAHYFRYQVDRTEVSFKRDGHTYTLFDAYEGESKKPRRLRGVQVDAPNARIKSMTLSCRGPVTSKLQTLTTIVPCDKENPLNMESCP